MQLDRLRGELADLDRELLAMVARRDALSAEIGRVKRGAGMQPRDFRQEREVIDRARRVAADLGLSSGLAEDLLLLLIRSSLTVQERDHVTARAGGSGRTALVIGGGGKMGRWFVRFLDSQGFRVAVADPSAPVPGHVHHADWRDAGTDHDVIVVAAPLRETNRILHDLAAAAPRGLVFDIGSLKTPLRTGLSALVDASVDVTSLHPMFGPDTELLSGRHVIFVDVGRPAAVREARRLFESTMAVPVEMNLDAHDRVIAYVLGLSHALNIVFFSALAGSGEAAPRLKRLSSTTFDEQLRIAATVAGENPHLYFEIQALNDYGADALGALKSAVERLDRAIHDRDEGAFTALMRRGREYLADREVR